MGGRCRGSDAASDLSRLALSSQTVLEIRVWSMQMDLIAGTSIENCDHHMEQRGGSCEQSLTALLLTGCRRVAQMLRATAYERMRTSTPGHPFPGGQISTSWLPSSSLRTLAGPFNPPPAPQCLHPLLRHSSVGGIALCPRKHRQETLQESDGSLQPSTTCLDSLDDQRHFRRSSHVNSSILPSYTNIIHFTSL